MPNGIKHMSGEGQTMKPSTANNGAPVLASLKANQAEGVPASQKPQNPGKPVPNGTCKAVPSTTLVNGGVTCNGRESSAAAGPAPASHTASHTTQVAPRGVKSDSDKPRTRGRGRASWTQKKDQDTKSAGRGPKPASPVAPGPPKPVFATPQGSSSSAPSSPPAMTSPAPAASVVPSNRPGAAVPPQIPPVTVASKTQPSGPSPQVSRSQPPVVAPSPRGTTVAATSVTHPQGDARTMTAPARRQPAVTRPQEGITSTGSLPSPAAAARVGNGPTPVSTTQTTAAHPQVPTAASATVVPSKTVPTVPHSRTDAPKNEVNGPLSPRSREAPAEEVKVEQEAKAAAPVAKPPAWCAGKTAKAVYDPPTASAVCAMKAKAWPPAATNGAPGGQASRPESQFWSSEQNPKNHKQKPGNVTQQRPKGPGKGITNEKDKCFAISVVQMLMNLDKMPEYWREWSNLKRNKTEQKLMNTLLNIREEYLKPNGKETVDAIFIKRLLEAVNDINFENGEHDVDEFFQKLLEQLHEEEKEQKKQQQMEREQAMETNGWVEVQRKKPASRPMGTLAEQLFGVYGQTQCNNNDNDRLWTFPLECPPTDTEQWFSWNIQDLKPSYPVTDLSCYVTVVLPISLIKHQRRKCRIEFEEDLVCKNWVQSKGCSHFKLKSVIFHQGANIEKGHYFCVVKMGEKWVKFDDSEHYEITYKQLKSIQTSVDQNEGWIMPFLAVYAPVGRR